MTYTRIVAGNPIYLVGTDNSIYTWGEGDSITHKSAPYLKKIRTYTDNIIYFSAMNGEYIVTTDVGTGMNAKEEHILGTRR